MSLTCFKPQLSHQIKLVSSYPCHSNVFYNNSNDIVFNDYIKGSDDRSKIICFEQFALDERMLPYSIHK